MDKTTPWKIEPHKITNHTVCYYTYTTLEPIASYVGKWQKGEQSNSYIASYVLTHISSYEAKCSCSIASYCVAGHL